MAVCKTCGTKLVFLDLAKGINPSKIQCSGCDQFIESKPIISIILIVSVVICALLLYSVPFSIGNWQVSNPVRLITIFILGGFVEYLHYLALTKGFIKSNLIIEK